jgi:hypothetical protein
MTRVLTKAGRPFWTAFTAFFANMVMLLGLDAVGAAKVDRTALTAGVASLFVALAIYGREKLTEMHDEGS